MKNMKKLFALALALVMVLALSATAFAAEDLTNGKVGAFTDYDDQVPTSGDASKQIQDRAVNIKKEIVANNASSTPVYAPVFTYNYVVTPATISNQTVTDDANVHSTNSPVVFPVLSGVTLGLVVNSNATPGNATSASGTLAFTNSDSFSTTADTTTNGSNFYDINLDFTNVSFPGPGVYRYVITESLANSATYAGLAMVNGDSEVRYLDVYVDGNGDIYGYVCLSSNDSVTTSTTKTNGFVGAAADTYYTYDLVVSKDVVNDGYAEANHAFPFTIIFTTSTDGTFKITETATTGSTGITPAAGTATWSGVATVKDSCPITYTGIPCGADVTIYETNDLTGLTYTVTTAINGTTVGTDDSVTSGTAPTTAAAQTSVLAYQSTKQTVDTTVGTAVASQQTFAITNTLLNISPTGVVLRVAPYMLMLGVGIFLLLVTRRRKEEEAAA